MRAKPIILCTFFLLGFAAATANASEEKLVGSWRVVYMKNGDHVVPIPNDSQMVMTFTVNPRRWRFAAQTKDHKEAEQGIWALRGDELTTVTDDRRKMEKIRVRFQGTVIELIKDSGTLVLERIP